MKSAELSELARRTGEPPISWLMKMRLERPGLISLAAGFTDNESLPVLETRRLLDEILGSRRRGRAALQYGGCAGDPVLRELTAKRLGALDAGAGGRTDASLEARTLITSGSQQLLYLVAEALCDPGDIVLLEDPTYFVFFGIMSTRGARCRGVGMEKDGINPERLEAVLESLVKSGEIRRLKFLYTVSYFQNPSGITTSFARKAQTLELLRSFERKAGRPIYLVEDAAYRELRFAGRDVPSALAAPRASDRVIYAGTYSKPFATGVRVGFGVLPEPVFQAVLRLKGNHDFGTSNLLQQLMSRALSSGAYQRQIERLAKRYAGKARVMQRAMRSAFPEKVQWDEPEGGLYFWARLPAGVKCGLKSRLFQRALDKGVLYVPGELCYADDPARRRPGNEMRLSFGNAGAGAIREGIGHLGEAIRELA